VSLKLRIHAEASNEAIESALWYERQRPGLGTEFQRAIDAALDILEEGLVPLRPVSLSAQARGVKRLGLKRFPFDVIVLESPGEVFVIAFAHHARRPGYWRERRPGSA
jgi:toxin ParE1/3/4